MKKQITIEGAHGTLKQWVVLNALVFVGFIGFIILAGEEAPNAPLSLVHWLLLKGFGIAIIVTCWLVGRILNAKGYLPNLDDMEE